MRFQQGAQTEIAAAPDPRMDAAHRERSELGCIVNLAQRNLAHRLVAVDAAAGAASEDYTKDTNSKTPKEKRYLLDPRN